MSSVVQDRVDREHVTPWFKFLWETYRTVLDILRNNARLEALYAMTAARAFQFCLTYKRTTEFRRLCDILRNHLANLNKYGITVAHNPAEMHALVHHYTLLHLLGISVTLSLHIRNLSKSWLLQLFRSQCT